MWMRAIDDGVELSLLITPRASRTEVVGVQDDALKVRVAAPPVEGKANAVLVKFFAKQLGAARSDVTIRFGETGRRKRLHVAGVDPAMVLTQLGMATGETR